MDTTMRTLPRGSESAAQAQWLAALLRQAADDLERQTGAQPDSGDVAFIGSEPDDRTSHRLTRAIRSESCVASFLAQHADTITLALDDSAPASVFIQYRSAAPLETGDLSVYP